MMIRYEISVFDICLSIHCKMHILHLLPLLLNYISLTQLILMSFFKQNYVATLSRNLEMDVALHHFL